MTYQLLDVIEESGSVGLNEKEIMEQTGMPKMIMKKALIRLRETGEIYQNYNERKWRLVKYRRSDEIPVNERMRFCAG